MTYRRFNRLTRCMAWLMTAVVVMTVTSCEDDRFNVPGYSAAGKDVTVRVPLSLPEMDRQTRATPGELALNRVESLWIRSYSATTGVATSDWKKLAPKTQDAEVAHEVELQTKSGSSYIVGVANVENEGVTSSDLNKKPLSDLLEAADTWEKFLSIAALTPSDFDDVYNVPTPMPMVGCFTNLAAGGDHTAKPHRYTDWQTENFIPYNIPGETGTLSGAIHLRRLVSHVKFNVETVNDSIDVTVNGYRVMKAPKYTWLLERSASEEKITGALANKANFGDLCGSQRDVENYYSDIRQFTQQYVTATPKTQTGNQLSTFDFWQGENKHTSTEEGLQYNGRDFVKNDLFTALAGDTWTSNNEASYVLIDCTIDYQDKKLTVNDKGVVTSDGNEVHRSANVTYMVHLGYIDDKANDFNCFRNVEYTYNLKVNGVNDIRLDAWVNNPDPETYSGQEGVISDLDNPMFYLDCHYGCFNVKLEQEELGTVSNGEFGIAIYTYRNGKYFEFDKPEDFEGVDPLLYNWIELRPTSGQDKYAAYKPYKDGDGKTFRLVDLVLPQEGDTDKTTAWDHLSDAQQSTSGWYTVYVNEYVYEDKDNVTGTGWREYVNQYPRRFYIKTTEHRSPDGNSVYSRAKWGAVQESIQSYYSTQTDGSETAVGIEHVNEMQGLNLRYSYTSTPLYNTNGRANVWNYIKTKDTDLSWGSFINVSNEEYDVPVIPEVKDTQGGSELPLRNAEQNQVCLPRLVNWYNKLPSQYYPSSFDPQPKSTNPDVYIEAINACMNRNRDNNGDGKIDKSELRWYVPSSGKYLRAILGRSSLPDPIMPYETVTKLPSTDNGKNTRYMLYASNNYLVWAMEGVSASNLVKNGSLIYQTESSNSSNYVRIPWNVRCVRNLGVNLNDIADSDDDGVLPAYRTDGNKIIMDYYDERSVRAEKYEGAGVYCPWITGTGRTGMMPVHLQTSDVNKVYKAFEVATPERNTCYNFKTDNRIRTQEGIVEYINDDPCKKWTQGNHSWRMPNQKELAIMLNSGFFKDSDGKNLLEDGDKMLSCTQCYYDPQGAAAAEPTSNLYFLASRNDGGTRLSGGNLLGPYDKETGTYLGYFFYVRCVRDVEP